MDNNNTGLLDRYEIDESLFTPEELEEIYSVASQSHSRASHSAPREEKQKKSRRKAPQLPEEPTVPEPAPAPAQDVPAAMPEPELPLPAEQPADVAPAAPAKKKKLSILGIAARCLSFVLATVLIVLCGALGVIYMLSRGPSDSARDLFVMSVRETSAVGFLSEIFLSDEEIELIVNSGKADIPAGTVDTSLISVKYSESSPSEDPGGETIPTNDPDGDGIEIIDVVGSTFNGKLMIIYDPNRVIVGVSDNLGAVGQTLESMIESYSAVGGVNGGGFYDPNGSGNGGIPDGVVVHDGVLLYGGNTYADTAVIDYDGILHVGRMTGQQAMDLGARWAVSFGPVLIVNGEKCDGLSSGLNPRTAIGQRADGAILLLVINGRQLDSMGATYEDVADVLLEHGAVNALNLDGGSSSNMMFHGEYLNISASVIGYRPLPTCVLVLEQEVQ